MVVLSNGVFRDEYCSNSGNSLLGQFNQNGLCTLGYVDKKFVLFIRKFENTLCKIMNAVDSKRIRVLVGNTHLTDNARKAKLVLFTNKHNTQSFRHSGIFIVLNEITVTLSLVKEQTYRRKD